MIESFTYYVKKHFLLKIHEDVTIKLLLCGVLTTSPHIFEQVTNNRINTSLNHMTCSKRKEKKKKSLS